MDFPIIIFFGLLGVFFFFNFVFIQFKANSGNSDQTPPFAASDHGLHSLPIFP